jgi:hypothetical protein
MLEQAQWVQRVQVEVALPHRLLALQIRAVAVLDVVGQ